MTKEVECPPLLCYNISIIKKEGNLVAWFDEAVFYHIYPLGMTGAPKLNSYEEPVHRLNELLPWIAHISGQSVATRFISDRFSSRSVTDTKQQTTRKPTADSAQTKT